MPYIKQTLFKERELTNYQAYQRKYHRELKKRCPSSLPKYLKHLDSDLFTDKLVHTAKEKNEIQKKRGCFIRCFINKAILFKQLNCKFRPFSYTIYKNKRYTFIKDVNPGGYSFISKTKEINKNNGWIHIYCGEIARGFSARTYNGDEMYIFAKNLTNDNKNSDKIFLSRIVYND